MLRILYSVMSTPIPDNFPALIERAAQEFGELEAISDGGTVLRYADLCDQIERCAAAINVHSL